MRTLIAAATLALLAACGPAKPKLEPPRVRIMQLDLADADSPGAQGFQLSLRVRNTTEAELPAHRQRLELSIDGRLAAILDLEVNVDIPPLGSEVIRSSGRFQSREVVVLQALGQGRRSQVPYSLAGKATADTFSLDLEYEGWLSAMPGRPGSFR